MGIYYQHEYPETTIINTASIVTAIRCQENHYRMDTISTGTVDPDASGCYSCPYYQKGVDCSLDCSHKQYELKQVKTYINEKNRFGHRQELPALALKLFLYMHFLRVDSRGYLRIELTEASEILSCSRRSIRRNLETLSKRGYIAYGNGPYTGTYQVFILSSTENEKTASQGGRGYFALSFDMFNIIKESQNVNELRLLLRGVVSALEGTTKNQMLQETSYRDIKRMLPAYATKKSIRNIVTSGRFAQMFGVKLSKENSFFYITMRDEFNPMRLRTDKVSSVMESLKASIINLNNEIKKSNRKDKTQVPPLSVTNEDLRDIANISLQIPVPYIEKALRRFHESYIRKGERIRSVGAMVRTLSWDIYGYEKLVTNT